IKGLEKHPRKLQTGRKPPKNRTESRQNNDSCRKVPANWTASKTDNIKGLEKHPRKLQTGRKPPKNRTESRQNNDSCRK
ncbi:hypothetical protein B1A91_12515, partial [Neisseria meningitidis]